MVGVGYCREWYDRGNDRVRYGKVGYIGRYGRCKVWYGRVRIFQGMGKVW